MGVVAGAFLFKDAVSLLELRQIAVVLRVKIGQLFMAIHNPPFRHDFRVGFLGFFKLLPEFVFCLFFFLAGQIGSCPEFVDLCIVFF